MEDATHNGRATTASYERQGLFSAVLLIVPVFPLMSRRLSNCSLFITLCWVVRESRRWRTPVMGDSQFSDRCGSLPSGGSSLPSGVYYELVLASNAPSQPPNAGADDPPCCLFFVRAGVKVPPSEGWVLHVVMFSCGDARVSRGMFGCSHGQRGWCSISGCMK